MSTAIIVSLPSPPFSLQLVTFETQHIRSTFWNGGEKAINFQTIFNSFFPRCLSFSLFLFLTFVFHLHNIYRARFGSDGGVIVASVRFFHGAFVVFVRSTVALLFHILFTFCSVLTLPYLCDVRKKMNLCNVYLLNHRWYLSTCVYEHTYYWHLAGWR